MLKNPFEVFTAGPKEDTETAEVELIFREKNILPLDVESWNQGDPVIYLLPDELRTDQGPFGKLNYAGRPHFAFLHAPSFVDTGDADMVPEGFCIKHGVCNEYGMNVDYYVVDKNTDSFRLVRTTYSIRLHDNPYVADQENLFDGRNFLA